MGLPLVALGQLAFSFYNVVLELLAPARIQTTIPTLQVASPPSPYFSHRKLTRVPPTQIVAVRFLITYVGCVTTMRARRIPHAFLGPPAVRGLLLLRGITGFLGIGFAVYHSLGYLTCVSPVFSWRGSLRARAWTWGHADTFTPLVRTRLRTPHFSGCTYRSAHTSSPATVQPRADALPPFHAYPRRSDSTTLSFLTPVMSGFMGHLFLNEPFTPRELASAFASLLGVVCITKPHAVFGGRDEDTLVSEAGETLGAGWGVGESKFAVGLGLLGVLSAAAACESPFQLPAVLRALFETDR